MPARPSVLVVDDEVSVAATLQIILESAGYKVRAVHSCAAALELLGNRHRFDVVITDLNMEQPNIGLEVARVALKLGRRPAVVIFTGFADTTNLRTAMAMQVDYVLTKPVEVPELLHTVRRLLAKRKAEGGGCGPNGKSPTQHGPGGSS